AIRFRGPGPAFAVQSIHPTPHAPPAKRLPGPWPHIPNSPIRVQYPAGLPRTTTQPTATSLPHTAPATVRPDVPAVCPALLIARLSGVVFLVVVDSPVRFQSADFLIGGRVRKSQFLTS